MTPPPERSQSPRLPTQSYGLRGALFWLFGTLGMLLFVQAVLEDRGISAAYLSPSSWPRVALWLGGEVSDVLWSGGDSQIVRLPLFPRLGALVGGISLITLCAGAAGVGPRNASFISRLLAWGDRGWRWWLAPGAWSVLSTICLMAQWEAPQQFLTESAEFWLAVAVAGWLCSWLEMRVARRSPLDEIPSRPDRSAKWIVISAIAGYAVVFTAMNWGLWFNLRVPHGDSAMYEEHLWNLEHGKGFRSYLDQGLFLGEHIQVIHVLLVPLHLLWPNHLLLELCQSLVLGLGAWPVYRMARRHGGSERAAALLACAYVLFVPLQYLDVTIDLKTFRPNSIGVPLLLFALDALEDRRYLRMCGWLGLVLACQEDYAIVIGLLGAWIMLTGASPVSASGPGVIDRCRALLGREHRRRLLLGIGLLFFGVAYLLLTLKVVLPYFRDGATIHYASYFEKFGQTPGEIVITMLTRPHRVLAEVFTIGGLIYALRLLVPLGGLPLRSPGRLLVAVPLFVLLCLNELAMQIPAPVHHFHAPVVPLLFWAAAAGLKSTADQPARSITRARFACACALLTGISAGISPLGVKFWDPGSTRHWQTLYIPDERAREFAKIDAMIPDDARVASTDFVHARFTHRERSYDYSSYLRAASNYEDRVPLDTDYIVLDVYDPYNEPQRIVELRTNLRTAVRELRQEPDRWELLSDPTGGYYVILRRAP